MPQVPRTFALPICTLLFWVGGSISSPTFAQDCPQLAGRWPYGGATVIAEDGGMAYFDSGTVLLAADV